MGFFKDAGDKISGVAKGLYERGKQAVTDIKGVGSQVVSAVTSAGRNAIEGGKTLITDPGRFMADLKDTAVTAGSHIKDSAVKGADQIQTAWSDARKGRGFFHALGQTVSGVVQIGSLGVSDALQDHFEASVEEHTDELGNVTGYSAKEGTDYITSLFVRKHGDRLAMKKNAKDEAREAMDEGDAARARKIDSKLFAATTGEDLKKAGRVAATAAVVAGGVALAIPSGGASLGAAASTMMVVSGATGLAGNALANSRIDFDSLNAEDDIADAVAEQVSVLKGAGLLDDEKASKYEEVMRDYYAVTLYNGADPNYGADAGFESNEDFRDWLLEANGLPTMTQAALMDRQQLSAAYSDAYAIYDGIMPEELKSGMAELGARYAADEIDADGYAAGVCGASRGLLLLPAANMADYATEQPGFGTAVVEAEARTYPAASETEAVRDEPTPDAENDYEMEML